MVRFSQQPAVRLFVGATLLITGLDDLVDAMYGSEGWLNVSVFHGVTLFGLQQVINGAGSLLDGVKETGAHPRVAGGTAPSATASDSQSRRSA
jgi:hypothetical protein